MAIEKSELLSWLKTLPKDAEVAVDDGGLALVEVDGDAYLEVGGIPESEEDDPLEIR